MARFVVDFDFSKLPPTGVEQIKISVLDTLGVALVGAKGRIGAILCDFVKEMGGNPQARLIGSGIKTSVLNAALANATFAHADDYDDMDSFGHPGCILAPTALALGEQLKLPGRKILEAYAIGFEVGRKLRAGMGAIERAGYHSSCLLGTMATAAESAKLLGLDIDRTRASLGIAASLASGIVQNFGTHTKPLHAGHAGRSGILAASLAEKGFTGDPNVLEAPRGFIYVFGQEQADIRRVAENIGNPLGIAQDGVRIKFWPSGHGSHASLTVLFHLIEKYNIRPEQVNAIEVVKSSPRETGGYIRNDPQRGDEGRFSMEYQLATALVDRKVDLYSFTDEKLFRPMIQDLIKKVTVVQDPEIAGLPLRLQGESPFTTLTLRLKDGRVLSERAGQVKLLTGEEIYDKFKENARFGGLTANKIERAIELVKGLENLRDVTELMDTVS